MNNPVTIPLNKSKLIKNLAIAVVFVAAAVLFILRPFWFIRSDNPSVIVTIGYILLVLFGLITFLLIKKWLDKTPGLTLDEEGLTDNSGSMAAAKVYWKDVRKVFRQEVAGQPFVMIEVKNPQHYLSAQKNPVKRQVMELNYRLYKTPVSIAAGSLRGDFDKLFSEIDRFFQQYK
ncbi:MAG TPA: STM3941 family protein [Chitinophagaceae bacterium]|nr:STM3941 family protein [Chitinophagaceae bacterium]